MTNEAWPAYQTKAENTAAVKVAYSNHAAKRKSKMAINGGYQ
jgi:hypothetical protein